MTRLINNFEGGPNGTTITTANSNQTGTQNAFNVASGGTPNAVLQYTDAGAAGLARPTAQYVMKISTGSTYDFPHVEWDTSSMASIPIIYTRFYVYFTSVAVNADTNDANLFTVSKGTSDAVTVWLRNTASPVVLQVWGNSPNTITNGTVAVTANEWHRLEFTCYVNNGSGYGTLYFYKGAAADSTTPTETISQSSQNYGGLLTSDNWSLGQWSFGQKNTPTHYYSNWELNNTGLPGPAPFRVGLGSPCGALTNPIATHCAVD